MSPQHLVAIALLAITTQAPALAQDAEYGYPKGSLGYEALVAADYARAEAQLLRDRRVAENDPARLLNLGHVMARTGRLAEAVRLFERALRAEEVDFLLADGRVMSSRDAARRALRLLNRAQR